MKLLHPTKSEVRRQERQRRAVVSPFDAPLVMTYFAKVRQADLLLANPEIDPSEIPHLMAEAQVTGKGPREVAQTIRTAHLEWAARDAAIEAKRHKNKNHGGTGANGKAHIHKLPAGAGS